MPVNFEIVKPLGIISTSKDEVYTKEVNLISYNGNEPKVDIRKWNRETDTMLKGIVLTKEEAVVLRQLLEEFEAPEEQ